MMSPSLRSSNTKKRKQYAGSIAIGISVLLSLAGCCIPKLQPPQPGAPTPASFGGAVASCENSAQIGWREFFDDPALVSLVDQALFGNQELKILAQQIEIANFEVLARRGAYLPFVSLGARAS